MNHVKKDCDEISRLFNLRDGDKTKIGSQVPVTIHTDDKSWIDHPNNNVDINC